MIFYKQKQVRLIKLDTIICTYTDKAFTILAADVVIQMQSSL